MPRKQYTIHYIYKTTNLINGKYYIGMHSTFDLNDGYMGSGKRLWYAFRKYGKENFKKEILEFLPDRKTLKIREEEIVNEELLHDENCYNLITGGNGGNLGPNGERYGSHGNDCYKSANAYWALPENKKRLIEFLTVNNRKRWEDPDYKEKMRQVSKRAFKNKKHTPETKKKMSLAQEGKQSGKNNSQYGTMWICNDELKLNKKINKDSEIPKGWRKGRIIK